MKLSIIVPIFNREPFLDKCINSILQQSFKDFELILVDDCSTDKSLEVCKKYKNLDTRIKIIEIKKNTGVSNARNAGLNIAKGMFIGFVDSDDYIDKDRFKIAVEDAEKYHADVVQCNIVNILHNGDIQNIKNSKNKEGLVKTGSTPSYPGSVAVKVIRKSFIDKYNIRFYTKSKYSEDTAFMALVYMYNPTIYCIDKVLYFRVLHDSTSSQVNNKIDILLNQLYTLAKCKYDLLERKAEQKWISRIERYIKNTLNSIDKQSAD